MSNKTKPKKPKIFCTLGYTTDNKIEQMVKAGMYGARINTAYCTNEEHMDRIGETTEILEKYDIEVPVMFDLKGPQLRTRTANPDMQYSIEKGIVIPIGFEETDDADIFLNYNIKKDIKEGDVILFENGTIATRVLENNGQTLVEVMREGEGIIKNSMGVNIPGRYLNLPSMSDNDKQVLEDCLDSRTTHIALSFVREAKDMRYLRRQVDKIAKEKGLDHYISLIAKIEDKQGCKNASEILDESDMLMVARGDLYNELNYAKLALVQESLCDLCHEKGKEVMIGTGILESMKYNTRPTRAEVGDVWNALRDKPDYLMLSAETSNGVAPVLAVNTLKRIIDDYHHVHKG